MAIFILHPVIAHGFCISADIQRPQAKKRMRYKNCLVIIYIYYIWLLFYCVLAENNSHKSSTSQNTLNECIKLHSFENTLLNSNPGKPFWKASHLLNKMHIRYMCIQKYSVHTNVLTGYSDQPSRNVPRLFSAF